MPSAPHSCRVGARIARARSRSSQLPSALLAALLLCPVACASSPRPEVFRAMREALAQLDDFGALLLEAGLPADKLPTGPELTPEEATRLRVSFGLYPSTSRTFGPRLVADALLREAVAGGAPVMRSALGARLLSYQHLRVMGPDGFLSAALTGTPALCVGPVEVRNGALLAGDFEVGGFYSPDGNGGWVRVVFRPPGERSP
jgi:hypothetical protein